MQTDRLARSDKMLMYAQVKLCRMSWEMLFAPERDVQQLHKISGAGICLQLFGICFRTIS